MKSDSPISPVKKQWGKPEVYVLDTNPESGTNNAAHEHTLVPTTISGSRFYKIENGSDLFNANFFPLGFFES
ncbi:MAG TPA: hypothetical protein VIM89_06560 [Mucilaginibacter sp.]